MLEQFAKVRAVFDPQRMDDLKALAKPMIGREGVFEALWEIEDGRPYAGQWAMGIPEEWKQELRAIGDYPKGRWVDGFCWVPSGDLRIIETVK